jgi:uncharacterized phage-associated protein
MTFDVRSIANLILETAELEDIAVTNLSLNKLVFFLHSEHLLQNDRPLITSKIEAWRYGPVIRELYSQFKKYGDKKITGKATHINKKLGIIEPCPIDIPEHLKNKLHQRCCEYLQLSAFQLVNLSHVSGGAWDIVYNHDSKSNPGMAITDDVIREAFARPSFN